MTPRGPSEASKRCRRPRVAATVVIARTLSPQLAFNLKTSLILRIDNLNLGTKYSFRSGWSEGPHGTPCVVPHHWPARAPIRGGRVALESVADLRRKISALVTDGANCTASFPATGLCSIRSMSRWMARACSRGSKTSRIRSISDSALATSASSTVSTSSASVPAESSRAAARPSWPAPRGLRSSRPQAPRIGPTQGRALKQLNCGRSLAQVTQNQRS